MKKEYIIKNLHCADCARSLEESINSFKSVKSCTINFVTESFKIETNDRDWDETIIKVKKILSDFNKNVVLLEKEKNEGVELVFKLTGEKDSQTIKKITESVLKLNEVNKVEFNFDKKLLTILVTKLDDVVIKRIKSLIKNIEPNIVIKQVNSNAKTWGKIKKTTKSVCFGLGIIGLLFVALIHFGVINTINNSLYYSVIVITSLLFGYSTFITALKMLLNKNINENLLVTISVFGAIIIGEHFEGLMVIALYTLGKMLEGSAVNRTRQDIKALMNIKPEFATIIKGGVEIKVRPEEVCLGDILVVKPGEKLAIDGVVVNGTSFIDTKSLTGESIPQKVEAGNEIISGVTILDGRLEVRTTKEYNASTVNKILELIETASEKKSKTETIISRFSKWYTLIVIGLAIITGTITSLVLSNIGEGVYRGLLFLVVSCPCAFAISVPLSYFSGIGNAAKNGILIKGTNYLDACAKTGIVAFDKTGTLTTGEFKICDIEVYEDAYSKEELLFIAAIGEVNSLHPVAKAIVNEFGTNPLPQAQNFKEIAGEGITFDYDGTEYSLGRVKSEDTAKTAVIIKKGNVSLGAIYLKDAIKQESQEAILGLKSMQIKTLVLSGDKELVAGKLANKLDIDEFKAELLPQDKFNYIDKLTKENSKTVIYVGDGINDAPSLALADVGVSMGINGSHASIEASDVVLVDDNPAKINTLVKISKFTKKIVLQNIVFTATIKALCLMLGAVGLASMIMAVFADVGVTVLAILNSLRVLNYKTKNK